MFVDLKKIVVVFFEFQLFSKSCYDGVLLLQLQVVDGCYVVCIIFLLQFSVLLEIEWLICSICWELVVLGMEMVMVVC